MFNTSLITILSGTHPQRFLEARRETHSETRVLAGGRVEEGDYYLER